MDNPKSLLRWSRSRYHPWLLRSAQAAGAVVVGVGVPGGALLATTHPQRHSALWTTALIAVLALVALAIFVVVVGGVAAFVTRPVRESHETELKDTMRSLQRSLESAVLDYGGDRQEQAFRIHYGSLWRKLQEWENERVEAADAQSALGSHIDSLMREHDINEGFNVNRIRGYARGVALERATGERSEPYAFEWGGTTTAVEPSEPPVTGPPVGILGPDLISLPPEEGESRADWRARAQPMVDRFESFWSEAWKQTVADASRAAEGKERVAAFQREQLPAIRATLELIGVREAPRYRHGCQTC